MDATSYLLGKKAGGGSGTTDYDALTNKPSINGVALSGNKTSEDLGIEVPTIPEDLLHYKGHVSTVNDLPSTGQTSAPEVSPYKKLNGTGIYSFSEFMTPTQRALTEFNTLKSNYTYALGCIGRDNAENADGIVCTEFPEVIKGIYMDIPTNWLNVVLVRIEATLEKPAYIKYNGTASYHKRAVADYDNNTQTASSSKEFLTVTEPCWFTIGTSCQYKCLVGNLPSNLKIIEYKDTNKYYIYGNGITQYTLNVYPLIKTWTINNFNYTYDYELFKFNSTTYVPSLITTETTIQENDTYTVGDAYEIYRANAIPQWEHWTNITNYIGYDATKTQVLKNVEGTLTWVDET